MERSKRIVTKSVGSLANIISKTLRRRLKKERARVEVTIAVEGARVRCKGVLKLKRAKTSPDFSRLLLASLGFPWLPWTSLGFSGERAVKELRYRVAFTLRESLRK